MLNVLSVNCILSFIECNHEPIKTLELNGKVTDIAVKLAIAFQGAFIR